MNTGNSSPYDWFDSKFTVSDLKDKTVDYRIRDENGHLYCGEGKLIAIQKGV